MPTFLTTVRFPDISTKFTTNDATIVSTIVSTIFPTNASAV